MLEREKLPEAYAHFQEAVRREEREKASQSMEAKRRASSTMDGTASSVMSMGPSSIKGASVEGVLPLKVVLGADRGSDVSELRVSLLAAGTQLEWTVERSWKDFVALHKGLKRYASEVPALPSKLIAPDRKRLQQWLDHITRSSILSATKEVYNFLSIGKTVELLSGAAHRARPETRALTTSFDMQKAPLTAVAESVPTPGLKDESIVLADDAALNRALEHLEHFFDESDGSEVGSLRAHKKGNEEERLSAYDIEQALQHLMKLQFTDTPSREVDDDQNDLNSDEEEEDTDATHNESREYEAGPRHLVEVRSHTAEFDLKSLVAEQKATIDSQNATIVKLRAKILDLESQLATKRK